MAARDQGTAPNLFLDTDAAVPAAKVSKPGQTKQIEQVKKRRSPLNMKVQRPRIPEKVRQSAGIYILTLYGYVVLELGQKKTPAVCRKCSRQQKRRVVAQCPSCKGVVWNGVSDNTTGTPDTMVSHPRWAGTLHVPLWTPLEYKAVEANGDEADVREEQADLVDRGLSQIAHDEHEAVAAVLRVEAALGIDPNPALLRWQLTNRKGYWTPQADLPPPA
jgi:hypothetical protein